MILPDPSWCNTALRRRLTSIISEPTCLAVCHFTLYLSADPFWRVFSKRQKLSVYSSVFPFASPFIWGSGWVFACGVSRPLPMKRRWSMSSHALIPEKKNQKMAARNVNSQVRSTVSCIESGSLFVSLARIPGFLMIFLAVCCPRVCVLSLDVFLTLSWGGYGSASRDAFLTNLRRLGWGGENEELLFEALNLHDKQDTETRIVAKDIAKVTKVAPKVSGHWDQTQSDWRVSLEHFDGLVEHACGLQHCATV